jgi:hypothetical protein
MLSEDEYRGRLMFVWRSAMGFRTLEDATMPHDDESLTRVT